MGFDADPHPNPYEQKSSFWRFSVREILLTTTAIAAIIALLISNRPRQTSAMAQQFDPATILTQILKDENLQGRTHESSSGSCSSPIELSKDFQIDLRDVSVTDVRSKVMLAFREDVRELIEQNGYKINGRSSSGIRDNGKQQWTALNSFSFKYKGQRIRGHLRVFTSFTGGDYDYPTLIIFLDEY